MIAAYKNGNSSGVFTPSKNHWKPIKQDNAYLFLQIKYYYAVLRKWFTINAMRSVPIYMYIN